MNKVKIHISGPISSEGAFALSVKLAEWAKILEKADEQAIEIETIVEGLAESFTLQPSLGHHPNQGEAS